MKYAAIGVTAFVFSAAPVSAQDAKQQQIDALNSRLEKLEKQNQKLMQLLEQQKSLPAVVREGLQKAAGAGTITKVESLTKHGELVAYEAQLRTSSKRSVNRPGIAGGSNL